MTSIIFALTQFLSMRWSAEQCCRRQWHGCRGVLVRFLVRHRRTCELVPQAPHARNYPADRMLATSVRVLVRRRDCTVKVCAYADMVNTKVASQFQPVVTPSAWHSSRYKNNKEWLVKLSSEHLWELRAALNQHKDVPEDAVHALSANDFPLPTLGPVLQSLRDEIVDGKGFAIVQGLSTADYSLRCPRQSKMPAHLSPQFRVLICDLCCCWAAETWWLRIGLSLSI